MVVRKINHLQDDIESVRTMISVLVEVCGTPGCVYVNTMAGLDRGKNYITVQTVVDYSENTK
jgi:hypothetical protein